MDYELWAALHDECGEDAVCCEEMTLDLEPEELSRFQATARLMGMSVDAFMHYCVRLGAFAEGY